MEMRRREDIPYEMKMKEKKEEEGTLQLQSAPYNILTSLSLTLKHSNKFVHLLSPAIHRAAAISITRRVCI